MTKQINNQRPLCIGHYNNYGPEEIFRALTYLSDFTKNKKSKRPSCNSVFGVFPELNLAVETEVLRTPKSPDLLFYNVYGLKRVTLRDLIHRDNLGRYSKDETLFFLLQGEYAFDVAFYDFDKDAVPKDKIKNIHGPCVSDPTLSERVNTLFEMATNYIELKEQSQNKK